MTQDLLGQKFGKYTVLGIGPKLGRNVQWICVCECGTLRPVLAMSLLAGRSKSCGCTKRLGNITTYRLLMKTYKDGAKVRHINFSLTEERFIELVNSPCHYCKAKSSRELNPYLYQSGNLTQCAIIHNIDLKYIETLNILFNGIDRKDNAIGYTESNSVACCKICNRAKMDMTYEDFMSWIRNLTNA